MTIYQFKANFFYKVSDYSAFFLFVLLLIGLYNFNLLKYWDQYTDSAGFVGLIDSIKNGNNMVSPVFTSFYSYIPFLAAIPDIFCNSELPSLYQEVSFIRWHPYFVAYPLAWASEILDLSALNISSFINALNFSLSVYILYIYLRIKNLNPLKSALFVVSIILFSPTSGYIIGQFYYDRLMLLPGLVMALTIFDEDFIKRFRLTILILTFTFCLIISERTALISSLILISYFSLNLFYKVKPIKYYLFIFGLIGLIYFYLYMRFIQNSEYYDGMSLSSAYSNFLALFDSNKVIGFLTLKWLIVLSPLLFLCAFEYRIILIVLMCLAPNLIITIGGGEKVGFLTHYHAVYLPILFAVSAMGYVKLAKILGNKIYILIIIFSIFNLSLNISEQNRVKFFDFNHAHQEFIKLTEISIMSNVHDRMRHKIKDTNNLLSSIPLNAKISLPEDLMPGAVVMGFRYIDYFPIGINSNDYIITRTDLESNLTDVTSYLDRDSRTKIEKCVSEIIDKKYTKIDIPKNDYSGPYNIFKRVNQ
jgi:hypothetical protein